MHKIAINPVMLQRGRVNRDNRDRAFTSVDTRKVAHIVVDMQTGFLAEGSPCEVPYAREIVPNINSISRAVRDGGGLNVFLTKAYDPSEAVPWTSWYSGFLGGPFSTDLARMLTPGSETQALSPDIDAAPGEPIINKTRFSGFTPGTSELDAILKSHGIETVIITGTLTNFCSESTARDANQLNYQVIFVSDGNATFTDEEHNATLSSLYAVFADVLPTSEVLELVEAGSRYPSAP